MRRCTTDWVVSRQMYFIPLANKGCHEIMKPDRWDK